MDNTTTNVQGKDIFGDDPDGFAFPLTDINGDTAGGEIIYNPTRKRKSISYKSELDKMIKERDKWRIRSIALIALYVISLIIKIIAS